MGRRAMACFSCGGQDLRLVLSLGRTPLANSLITEASLDSTDLTFPLELAFCPACALVQITETVPPETLFRDYLYFSSFSETMVSHAERIATRLISLRGLSDRDLVVEVASNDGYLLQFYKKAGVQVVGIEPARNVAKVAIEERGIPTETEFFGDAFARRLAESGRRAAVVHANNVLAHVPDQNGFVTGIRTVLTTGGIAVIEVPYVRDLIDHLEFDTIYHEHLCYYSLTALDCLFHRNGLTIVDVERLSIHGGSLRIFAAPGADNQKAGSVRALLEEERRLGMTEFSYYAEFADKVRRLRGSLVNVLSGLKADGKRIAAYGASAKGSTLLNYFGIGRETLDFVVDRSTYKRGRYMPGVRLPIYAPSKLLEAMPPFTLLLTWNFRDEILVQQAEYCRRGGQFIVPVPEVKFVGLADAGQ